MDKQQDLQLASELRTVVTRLIKKLRTKSAADEKLSLTERSVLKLLDECKELAAGELAGKEKITGQSMSQILNHLSELGYILRKTSETDKRKVSITLSKAGRDFFHKVRHERDEWLSNAIQQTFTLREKEALRKTLEPLTRLIDFE